MITFDERKIKSSKLMKIPMSKKEERICYSIICLLQRNAAVSTHTQTHTILLREMRCSKMCFAILFCKQAEKYNIKEKINSQQEIIIIKKLFKTELSADEKKNQNTRKLLAFSYSFCKYNIAILTKTTKSN